MTYIATFFTGIAALVGSWFGAPHPDISATPASATTTTKSHTDTSSPASATISADTTSTSGQHVYSQDELLTMADNSLASGSVPLGDSKYVTSAAKKGYVYLCNVHKDNPGSMVNGPWIHGTTWNFLEKISIAGSVAWPNAYFTNVISGAYRVLTGNDLPTTHTTGTFPVASSDPAAAYDKNPNTISAQTFKQSLPVNPTYSATPYCMGGEVGVMTDGVPLFNAFDAGLRDAPAHELQDTCEGHPQGSGEYHYHSLSACFKDIKETTVLGYAYDGFPITGPEVAANKFLTTDDLDECHGLTSIINVDGKQKTTYHYVMTKDFPYSASCFRGKPVTTGPSGGAPNAAAFGGTSTSGSMPTQQGQGAQPQGGTPPAEATAACSGKFSGAGCSFTTPRGTLSGTCQTPPNNTLACVPTR